MKFAICQELYENWDWEHQCRFSAELGYTGLELAPFTLAPRITDVPVETLRSMREVATRHGVEVIGLHWLLAKTTGLHLTTADPLVRRATSEYLAALARGCAELGGTLMVLGSPMQRNLDASTSREQGMERAAEVLRGAVPTFNECGVRLCVEPLTPAETNFLTSCADGMELVERVGDRSVTLHQDVKAMLAEKSPVPDVIREFAGKIGHFHVNDGNLLGPGMGPTDYHPILRALRETKYDGWVSVEVFDYKPGAEHIARASIEYLRAVLADLDAEVA
jgi:sugar phosphate isomerase/epimerase